MQSKNESVSRLVVKIPNNPRGAWVEVNCTIKNESNKLQPMQKLNPQSFLALKFFYKAIN
jgi:hypothetical protein